MRLKINVKNKIKFNKYEARAKKVLKLDILEGAMNIVNQAKRNASGRPGPRVDTGYLRNSIMIMQYPTEQDPRATVIVNAEYGVGLELGTRHHKPYPFFIPAVTTERERVEKEGKIILSEILGI